MTETARHRRPVEDRIVAAEVALEERLPAVACLFLANVPLVKLRRASEVVRARYLRVARAVKVAAV